MASEKVVSIHDRVNDDLFEGELKESLLAANAVKEMDFARAKRVRAEQVENESIVSLLVRLGMVSERAMAQALAETLPLEICKPALFPSTPIAEDLLSSRFLHDQMILPLAMADGILRVAMSDRPNPSQYTHLRWPAMPRCCPVLQ